MKPVCLTCSRVAEKHNVEAFTLNRRTLSQSHFNLVLDPQYLPLNIFQSDHIHDSINSGAARAFDILLALPLIFWR